MNKNKTIIQTATEECGIRGIPYIDTHIILGTFDEEVVKKIHQVNCYHKDPGDFKNLMGVCEHSHATYNEECIFCEECPACDQMVNTKMETLENHLKIYCLANPKSQTLKNKVAGCPLCDHPETNFSHYKRGLLDCRQSKIKINDELNRRRCIETNQNQVYYKVPSQKRLSSAKNH